VAAKKLLIIEDDEDVYDYLQPFLIQNGYAVDVATNGEDGLVKIKDFAPHLVILDLMMPGIDGFELLKRLLTSVGKKPPVLVLTAVQEMGNVERALRWGAKGYLLKPVENERLLGKIKELLDL
jgi:DNA-binding response OmpR family regulator